MRQLLCSQRAHGSVCLTPPPAQGLCPPCSPLTIIMGGTAACCSTALGCFGWEEMCFSTMRKPRSVWAGLTWAVRCGCERSTCGCSAGEAEPQDQPVTWTAWRDLCALILFGKCGKPRYFMAVISLSSYVFTRESEIHSFRELKRCVGWEGLAMKYSPPALSIHLQKTVHPNSKGCMLAGTCARLEFHSNAIEN